MPARTHTQSEAGCFSSVFLFKSVMSCHFFHVKLTTYSTDTGDTMEPFSLGRANSQFVQTLLSDNGKNLG